MTTARPDTAAERLVERLLSSPGDPAAWELHGALTEKDRRAVAEALRREVESLVRTRPSAAPGVAEVLMRAVDGLPDLVCVALRSRATAAHFNGRHADAVVDFERAAKLYRRQGQLLEAARVWRSLVEVLQLSGHRDRALEYAERARAVFLARGESQLLAQLEVNVGNLYLRLDEYPAARVHYAQAREHFSRLGHDSSVAVVDFNLAVIEMNANRIEEAEAAWRSARDRFERADQSVYVADCDYSLSYLESRRGNFGEAIEGLMRARETYSWNGKPSGVPLCDLDLAEIYLQLDARRDALECAQRAGEAFAAIGLEYELAKCEALQGLALARLSEVDRAFARLESAGFPAYLTPGAREGDHWRVRVGPYPSREEAELAALRLERGEKLPTWVLDEDAE